MKMKFPTTKIGETVYAWIPHLRIAHPLDSRPKKSSLNAIHYLTIKKTYIYETTKR